MPVACIRTLPRSLLRANAKALINNTGTVATLRASKPSTSSGLVLLNACLSLLSPQSFPRSVLLHALFLRGELGLMRHV